MGLLQGKFLILKLVWMTVISCLLPVLVFFGHCYHLQFPSENRAPRGLPFSSELFLSVCTWPHRISSLQQADTNSLSPLISKATPLLGAAHRGIFSSWLVVAFGCERSRLCLSWFTDCLFHPHSQYLLNDSSLKYIAQRSDFPHSHR